jgi:streptomycin 6-kinase
MSMNYIEFATTAAGEPVTLKVGVPHAELFTEMEALRLYDARGAVRLLDVDRDLGAILMQRLQPGTMLWLLGNNRRETEIAASIMSALSVPVPSRHNLPAFSRWVERAFRLTRTEWDPQQLMPRDLIDRAEKAFREIERNTTGDVVLHGDLHHENILLDDRSGWTAIDPKGVIGPPCLQVGRFLQNQLPSSLPVERREEMVRERVHILSTELGYTRETVAASGLVDCVLSHCWCFEDEGFDADWYNGIELARMLCRMCRL